MHAGEAPVHLCLAVAQVNYRCDSPNPTSGVMKAVAAERRLPAMLVALTTLVPLVIMVVAVTIMIVIALNWASDAHDTAYQQHGQPTQHHHGNALVHGHQNLLRGPPLSGAGRKRLRIKTTGVTGTPGQIWPQG